MSPKADAECLNCDARPGLLSAEGLCNECHITAAHRKERENVAGPTCSKCSAPFKPNDYSISTSMCGYCAHSAALAHAIDNTPAKFLPKEPAAKRASRYDARAIDLEQAWSTPTSES